VPPSGIPPQPQRSQVRTLRPIPGAVVSAPPASPGAGSVGGRPGQPGRPAMPAGRTGPLGARPESAATAAAPEPGAKKPSTVYIPQDNRPRKRTRRGKRGPGEFGPEESRHLDSPRTPRGTILPKQRPVFAELRSLKVVEGITVKDFAEKIEVKPKDVVAEML